MSCNCNNKSSNNSYPMVWSITKPNYMYDERAYCRWIYMGNNMWAWVCRTDIGGGNRIGNIGGVTLSKFELPNSMIKADSGTFNDVNNSQSYGAGQACPKPLINVGGSCVGNFGYEYGISGSGVNLSKYSNAKNSSPNGQKLPGGDERSGCRGAAPACSGGCRAECVCYNNECSYECTCDWTY